MPSLNQVMLIGNVGKDPKISQGANGGKVVSFPIATTEKGYTKQDGSKAEDQTEWHNIVLFGKLAEIGERYLKKGSCVFVQGKLKTRSYEDKDGNKRYMTEIVGGMIQMLDSKEKSQQSENITSGQPINPTSSYAGQSVSNIIAEAQAENDENLPF